MSGADPFVALGIHNEPAPLAVHHPPADDADFKPFVVRQCLADVQPETVQWLWPGRIPYGKLTLLCGDPGLGKSFLTLALATTLSRGAAWPDQRDTPIEPGNTVILSAEDDPADTIRPRLDAAGADVSRVWTIGGVIRTHDSEPKPICLGGDLRHLEQCIVDVGARLCIVDPISAYLGDSDSHSNAAVRALLHPLSEMAARNRCAVVAVTHLRKSGADRAVYRAMGSLAFTAAARIAWLVAKDKDDESKRLMVALKCNLIEEPKGIAFRIEDGRLCWLPGEVAADPESLLAADGPARAERDAACEWLQQYLLLSPAPVGEIRKASEADCHAWRTIERAKKSLGVISHREGYGKSGRFLWELPAEDVAVNEPIGRQVEAGGQCDNSPEKGVSAIGRQTQMFGGQCENGRKNGTQQKGIL